jgi:hypothetical protein
MECLNSESRIQVQLSFLASSLEMVYIQMLQSFQQLSWKSHAALGTFLYRLFKLTRLLLEKFLDVPQTQKAPLI